jgi:PqqA peptide cyclase
MNSSPLGLILELTHRCPLRCLYCSNPLELAKKSEEITTEVWCQVLEQAVELGILQVYLTGGEPCLRQDLEAIAARASACGLYVNLITSGVGLTEKRCQSLCKAGVRHIQLSLQDIDREGAKRISGVEVLDKKKEAARIIRKSQTAFTLNVVVHRQNLSRLPEMIEAALEMGADKLEVAHVQMNGWALRNRDFLLPTEEQVRWSLEILNEARENFKGQIRIDYVLSDYYAKYPKACMNGWAQNMMLIDPQGRALPCHSAVTLPNIKFPSIAEMSLRAIWQESELFNLFRGQDWMPEICRTCERKEIDFGGCRCQAFALTGDAGNADPVCHRSPFRSRVARAISNAVGEAPEPYHRPVTII